MTTRRLTLTSPDETSRLAAHIAGALGPGDCLLLEGPIGAGKSHFARALIQSLLGYAEDVPSPTFTLVQTYDTPAGEVWHSDLYRLTMLDEIEELGLTEAFEEAICLVEWPDRLGDLAPSDALTLSLTPDRATEGTRHLEMSWSSPRWTPLITDLAND